MLSVAVNFVPIDNVVAFSVGFFYIVLIGVIVLFLISLLIERPTLNSWVVIIISAGLVNLAIVGFLADSVTLGNYFKVLSFWILPFLIVYTIIYYYVWIKELKLAIIAVVYCIFLYFYLLFIAKEYSLLWLENMLIPGFTILLFIVGIPFVIAIRSISNKKILIGCKIFLWGVWGIVGIPLFLGLICKVIDHISTVIITLIVILLLIAAVYMLFFKLLIKFRNQKSNNSEGVLWIEKPIAVSLYILTIFLVLGVFLPFYLIKGGDYMHSIIKTNGYQKIEYIWGQEKKYIEGTIISNRNDTYYISTIDRELMIIKAKDIVIGPN
ncbi:hypothetical protein [Bacillus tropicus]|uniref:hypothetical protein n=1 Tax=Bacillus tropicus TaxID=2026188 RepID=UPI003ED9F2C5